MGRPRFVHPDRYPEPGEVFQEGSVGYHLRRGDHFLAPEDWQRYMDFIEKSPPVENAGR